MTPTLETDRLLLLPLRLSDAEQTQILFPHWEIVRYLNSSVPWPYPNDGAVTFYRDQALPAIGRGDEWHWMLYLKEAPERHIGSILLSNQEGENRGFWLGPPWQRQGLMAEAVFAVTDFWFGVLGKAMLRTRKAVANEASRRLSLKTGMRLIGVEDHPFVSGVLPAEIWEITADEWARNK